MAVDLTQILGEIAAAVRHPVYLVGGDTVVAEPGAQRIASALADAYGCEVVSHRRPAQLGPILDDLRTLSLFSNGKVVLVVDCALFADRGSVADLIDDAAEALPLADSPELTPKERVAAGRMLQALRLFGVEPEGSQPSSLLESLPQWAYQGGRTVRRRNPRGRGKRQVADLRQSLAVLLERAREEGLRGWADSDLANLGEIIEGGLPDQHALVLAESRWASGHPVVERLLDARAAVDVGRVELDRRGELRGLEKLTAELERETGVRIDRRALEELGRRTLRKSSERGRRSEIASESTARLGAEYRKLAGLAEGGAIDIDLVRSVTEDRGDEDVWALLDDIAAGRPGRALQRLRRLQLSADDVVAARLSVFALLADFCRQLTAVRGLLSVLGVPGGERNYRRFKDRLAPRLQSELTGGLENPIAGLHPFRLHRVYLAASRLDEATLRGLPARVLETETRLKGESGDADTALAELAVSVGGAVGACRAAGMA